MEEDDDDDDRKLQKIVRKASPHFTLKIKTSRVASGLEWTHEFTFAVKISLNSRSEGTDLQVSLHNASARRKSTLVSP